MLARLTLLLRETTSSLFSFCSFRRFLIITGTVLLFLIFFYIKYATDVVSLSSQTALPSTMVTQKASPTNAPEVPKLNTSVLDKIPMALPAATPSTISTVDNAVEACGGGEAVHEEGPCRPCTLFELTSKAAFCLRTGYKEPFRCGSSSEGAGESRRSTMFWRNCENTAAIEARNFQIFSVLSCASALLLSAFVYWRHYALNKDYIKKIQQRINTG